MTNEKLTLGLILIWMKLHWLVKNNRGKINNKVAPGVEGGRKGELKRERERERVNLAVVKN